MNKHFQRAFDLLVAAKPASGFRPETQAEWVALLKAHEGMGYAIFRDAGKSDAEARALARELFGGAAALMLLDIAFSGDGNVTSRT